MPPAQDSQAYTSADPFIDAHCHLFNIVDVPLYESIAGLIDMGTIKNLLAGFFAGAAIVSRELPEALKKQRNFLRFFERDITENIGWLDRELKNAVHFDNKINKALKDYGYRNNRIIITPLVMDFDSNRLETEIGRDCLCTDQVRRLFHAIEDAGVSTEIYPFAGFALDKLNVDNTEFEAFKEWWHDNSLDAEDRAKGRLTPLRSGKVIGIKLYPPLGFSPIPTDEGARKRYVAFFKWCVDNDIPITVHCQESSYSGAKGDSIDRINRLTNPKNWEQLFKEHPELHGLRINFGHFGGSGELDKMMKGINPNITSQTLNDSWSLTICRLLSNYPNTYADISAFKFEEEDDRKGLAKLIGGSMTLYKDTWITNLEAIQNKIMWGSDVPMVLASPSFLDGNGKPSYASLLEKFYNCLLINDPFGSTNQAMSCRAFNKVTRSNPSEFLFGH